MPLNNDCINHIGCKLPNGYGKVGRNGKTWLAHRYAWYCKHGEIPNGMHVCHKCDNRSCVNVDHLFLGTRKDNMQDMIAKGRAKFVGFLSPNFRPPSPRKGEKNGRSKLTTNQVNEIRGLPKTKHKDIAEMYGVSTATIQRVIAGTTWA